MFEKVKPTTQEQIELNNRSGSKVRDICANKNNRFIEIFTAATRGKDTSKYGKDVDVVLNYVKSLGERAVNGDLSAKAEVNAIRTVMIQTPLLQRLNLFSFMGDVTTVGFNEELRYKVYNLDGKMSNIQANSGSFPFPTVKWRTEIMPSKAATGGVAIDYREMANLDLDAINIAHEQVMTDIMNQMFYDVMLSLYNGVKTAKQNSKITNFIENSGLTKTAVDSVIKTARRWGNVGISGDYSVIEQMEGFVGFKTDTNPSGTSVTFSDAVMEEIRQTGYIKTYKGIPVTEIPNTYNLTKLNTAGDFYESYLPEGLLFVLPTGVASPLKVGIKGGLRSMTGTDIDTAQEITRYDLEWGCVLIPELTPMVGLVSDSNYAVDKR